MTESDADNREAKRREAAKKFDRELDPYAKYQEGLEEISYDPLEDFRLKSIENTNKSQSTKRYLNRFLDDWREFCQDHNRHPACPNEDLAKAFLRRERDERDNCWRYARRKMNLYIDMMNFIHNEQALPHDSDYTPFQKAKKTVTYDTEESKPMPPIDLPEVRERVQSIGMISDTVMAVNGFKFLLRPGANARIKISEIHIDSPELQELYPNLGTHHIFDVLDVRNAIYISSNNERTGFKSARPRLFPLDSETRTIYAKYLKVRDFMENEYLFPGETGDGHPQSRTVRRKIANPFLPEYDENENHRGVSGGFPRHFATTYWSQDVDINTYKLEYMRGDKTGKLHSQTRAAIDDYVHTHYSDIKNVFLDNVFQLFD